MRIGVKAADDLKFLKNLRISVYNRNEEHIIESVARVSPQFTQRKETQEIMNAFSSSLSLSYLSLFSNDQVRTISG